MLPRKQALLETPIGPLSLCWQGFELAGIDLCPPTPCAGGREQVPGSAVPEWLAADFAEYFSNPTHRFRCPTMATGSSFQRRVWATIAAIPAGETRTYGAVAAALGTSPRAVGNACRTNPVPLVVPCHRVVGRQGLGGFAGDIDGRLLAIKRWLLRHEGAEPAYSR